MGAGLSLCTARLSTFAKHLCYNRVVPILVETPRRELDVLLSDTPAELSVPLKFGLGAGLYFQYLHRPHESPSRRISGLNRNLASSLAPRLILYGADNRGTVIREALQENALLFNLDRAPTTALMGIEMLAEHLTDFSSLPDWQSCLSEMHTEIVATDALYRRTYLQFLQEIGAHIDTAALCGELSEIADEWDAFAAQLLVTLRETAQLERTGRMLRRLAFREEHFWGNVLEVSGSK